MIELPNVTILTVNCVDANEGIAAINYSRKGINFKEAILFTHEDVYAPDIKVIKIPRLKSVDEYNDFILRLGDFNIDSDFVMVVQDDGYPININNWDNRFLDFDYIGAVWPNERSWIERQQTRNWMHSDWNRVGNGGFSLRSRKFLILSSTFSSCKGFGEDVFLSLVNHKYMVDNGINFAPVELAQKFSYENNLENWREPGIFDTEKHFGFHGKNFINSQELIDLKNE